MDLSITPTGTVSGDAGTIVNYTIVSNVGSSLGLLSRSRPYALRWVDTVMPQGLYEVVSMSLEGTSAQ